jgi:hypothetical protein
MDYFQVSEARPGADAICSDNDCPCGWPGATIPRGTGYLYVSPTVAEFRSDARTEWEATQKINRLREAAPLVFVDQNVAAPTLMCEQGAVKRGLDLEVAAADARYWWQTGMVPLRPTPLAVVPAASPPEPAPAQEPEWASAPETAPVAEPAAAPAEWAPAPARAPVEEPVVQALPDEILRPQDVSAARLKALFDDANVEAWIDEDGNLHVKETYNCALRPDPDGKLIAISAAFGVAEGSSRATQMEFANRVNDQVKVVRASLTADGRYFLDYYIPIDGGTTGRAVVSATRRFFACVEAAIARDTENVVA